MDHCSSSTSTKSAIASTEESITKDKTTEVIDTITEIQGDPNQNLLLQMAITLKIRFYELMLVKPKCVWVVKVYLCFSAVCLQFSKINLDLSNTLWLYQHKVGNTYFQSYSHLK